jgi:hypothetical protein
MAGIDVQPQMRVVPRRRLLNHPADGCVLCSHLAVSHLGASGLAVGAPGFSMRAGGSPIWDDVVPDVVPITLSETLRHRLIGLSFPHRIDHD